MSAEMFWKMNTESSTEDKAMGEKHAPTIAVEGECKAGQPVKVKVGIGNGKHPNENAHHIQWIELRCNDLYIGRVEFSPVILEPQAEFTMNIPGGEQLTLTAISRCNLHGLWKTEKTCQVAR